MPKEYKFFLCGKYHIKIKRPIKQAPLKNMSQNYMDDCCSAHLQGQNFLQPSLAVLEAKYEKSFFNPTDLVSLLENVRLTLKKSCILDFDNGDS